MVLFEEAVTHYYIEYWYLMYISVYLFNFFERLYSIKVLFGFS